VVQSDGEALITAKDGISKPVVDLTRPETIAMSALNVGVQNTLKRTAHRALQTDSVIKRPRYLCGMAWFIDELSFSPTAKSSLYVNPLPSPGIRDFSETALTSLKSRPDLFAIITPINITVFRELLQNHPNCAFVESILKGLSEGFWPCADTALDGYPLTWDNSYRPLKNEEHLAFVQEQVDVEVQLGRFSHSFGLDLLGGMYSTPIHVVPKPNSTKLRLVVDHSAGEFSLNSMIDLDDSSGIKLDGMCSLGLSLLQFRREHGNVPLVVFKSDISQAYHCLPMHPLWQLKQVITVNNNRYVDRCNNFGGRGSALIWVSFMSLVTWIASVIIMIEHLKLYMDDSFSFELEGNVLLYEPYGSYLPRKQVLLLWLWDSLGIPHEPAKQVFGRQLTIIGFVVDPNKMVISIPEEKKKEIIAYIRTFAVPRHHHTLREFQQIVGTVNWLFNVFPLLKPGLSSVYDKMRGKTKPLAQIYVNLDILQELMWLANHMESMSGVLLLDSLDWSPETAEDVVTIYTDASLVRLGFWYPEINFGFQVQLPRNAPLGSIFFFEALAVCSAIHFLADTEPIPCHVAIFTDNTNTVDIFNSLQASAPYNRILISAVNVLIKLKVDLQVYHVSGAENSIADALSRFDNERALGLVPDLIIDDFKPPRDALGATKK
jgi:hypothetical protein